METTIKKQTLTQREDTEGSKEVERRKEESGEGSKTMKRRARRDSGSEEERKRVRDSSTDSSCSSGGSSSLGSIIDPGEWKELTDWFEVKSLGEADVSYMEKNYGRIFELFNEEELFKEKVDKLSAQEWLAATRELNNFGETCVMDLQMTSKSRVCVRCKPGSQYGAVYASYMQRRYEWALTETYRWYVRALKGLKAEAKSGAGLLKSHHEITVELETIKQEKALLLAKVQALEAKGVQGREKNRERELGDERASSPIPMKAMETEETDRETEPPPPPMLTPADFIKSLGDMVRREVVEALRRSGITERRPPLHCSCPRTTVLGGSGSGGATGRRRRLEPNQWLRGPKGARSRQSSSPPEGGGE